MKIYKLGIINNSGFINPKDWQGIDDLRYDDMYIGSKKNIIKNKIELEYEDRDGKIVLKETKKV